MRTSLQNECHNAENDDGQSRYDEHRQRERSHNCQVMLNETLQQTCILLYCCTQAFLSLSSLPIHCQQSHSHDGIANPAQEEL